MELNAYMKEAIKTRSNLYSETEDTYHNVEK